jgi:DNA-nicking Smr family endonuclease
MRRRSDAGCGQCDLATPANRPVARSEVITGRGATEGGGVLRRELPLWLNLPDLRPMVLAVTHPHPGNPGSVRLLLRRPRS